MVLSDKVKELISEMAEEVREVYGITTPIVNIKQIVRNIGGDIIEKNNSYYECKLRRTSKIRFVIEIPMDRSEGAKNFLIAHELGHLFLHLGFGTKLWEEQFGEYDNKNTYYDHQANEFAYSFLMPKQEYKIIMDKYTNGNQVNTKKIAEYFNVAVDAASSRGKRLGYLEWW